MKNSDDRKPALRDLALAAAAFLLILVGLIAFDVFERVFQFTREHEGWELDELVAIVPAAAFAAAWFAYRRWRESERLRRTLARSVDELRARTGELAAANQKALVAQAALRSSELALSQAHQVARLAHWRWSFEERRLIYWSDGFAEMYGIANDEVDPEDEGQFRFIHPDDRPHLVAIYAAATPENPSFEAQYRVLRPSGEVRYFREVAEPEKDSEGRVISQFGIIQDITEQRKAEMALGESERRYRSLYYNTPAMMHSIDATGCLVSVSDHWLEVMGHQRHEVIGRELVEFMTEASADYARRVGLPEFRRTGRITDVEYNFVKKNGEVIEVLLSAITERDQDGRFVRSLAVINDVTERNRIEAKLRQALRLEAVGQLTGGVAHDFNNLLASIMLNLGFLKNKPGGEAQQPFVEQIHKALDRGQALTERLLAFSRKQPLSPQSSDVSELVEELDNMLRLTLGAAVELEIRHAEDLWPAMIDPSQFDNALVNLAINARDAMPKGGRLVIETANATLDAASAGRHEDLAPGCYVTLAVKDSGQGMTPEVLAKAFEPFFTTRRDGGGSGLGLSMVYGFVKQSKGHVTVDSEVGRGTTVTLYLPRAETTPIKVEPVKPPAAVAPGSERVLLVEDDPELRQAAMKVLRDKGYETIEAETGKEALEQLRSGAPIDLLLTDVVLPGNMNGADLAAEARKRQPGLKVLYITGYAESVFDPKEGAPDPGIRLIRKPFPQEKLLAQVRALCDSKSVLLIEDEDAVRIALAKALEYAGYSVACAVNGAEATVLIESQPFDAVVTDIVMDEVEGVETLKAIQESGSGVPVIAISGYPTYLRSIRYLGAAATLKKPFEAEALLETLDQVLQPGQDRPRANSA